MSSRTHTVVMLAACAVLTFGAVARADEDWPQWRGPNRDGMSPGADWPDRIAGERLERRWSVDGLGESYSGPVIVGERVFTTETVEKKRERVRCLDRKTGKEIWAKEWDGTFNVAFFAARNGSWVRATPACDGDALFVAGIRDVLVCLDVSDGKERWRFDFVKEFDSPMPSFGFVSSPILDGDSVYVQAGGRVVKLDKKTGKPKWKSLQEGDAMMGSAFSSPVFAKLAGKDQLVVQTRTRLAGVNRDTGDVLWEHAVPSFRGMNILTPIPVGDAIFTSTYGGNTRLVSVTAKDEKQAAKDSWGLKYEGNMTTPIVIDNHAYVFGKDRRFLCVDLKSGVEKWRSEQRYGEYWSMVARKDKILALDSAGKLFLIRANPAKFEILDERPISRAETWAHPAIVGDELYIRDLFSLTAYKWSSGK